MMRIRLSRQLSCFILVFPMMIGCSRGQAAGGPAIASFDGRATNSPPIQATVDLGVIFQGQAMTYNRWIENGSERKLHVAAINVSCDCLTVRIASKQIESKARVLASFHYDGAKEPNFTGGLAIDVELIDDNREQVGQITVPLEVVRIPIYDQLAE